MALQWMLYGVTILMVVVLALSTLLLLLKVADLREQLGRSGDALDSQRRLYATALRHLESAETALRKERLQHERTRHKFWLLEQLVPALQPVRPQNARVLTAGGGSDADRDVVQG